MVVYDFTGRRSESSLVSFVLVLVTFMFIYDIICQPRMSGKAFQWCFFKQLDLDQFTSVTNKTRQKNTFQYMEHTIYRVETRQPTMFSLNNNGAFQTRWNEIFNSCLPINYHFRKPYGMKLLKNQTLINN